jgi:hypothetical protein
MSELQDFKKKIVFSDPSDLFTYIGTGYYPISDNMICNSGL